MPANFHVWWLVATGAVVYAVPPHPDEIASFVQTKTYDMNSKLLHMGDRAPQAVSSSKSCGAVLEVDVKKEAAGAIGAMPIATQVRVISNHRQRLFGVHPGYEGTNARIDGSLDNTNIGFTLSLGDWHKMFITLGCDGEHTFNVTDGINPSNSWETTFTMADYYAGDLSSIIVTVGHPSPTGPIAGPPIGTTKCYQNEGTHCFKLVTAPTPITKASQIQHSKRAKRSSGDLDTCSAWGDVHFRGFNAYSGVEFDWMGLGVYNLATCDEKDIAVQVYQCPAEFNGVTWATACAIRAGNHTITVIGMDCFIDGVPVTKADNQLTGGVVVEKEVGYITVLGPRSGPLNDFGIVKVRLSRVEGRNPMDMAQNVYVTLPTTTDFVNISGLCTNSIKYNGFQESHSLFGANETSFLEQQCKNLSNWRQYDRPWDPETPEGPLLDNMCGKCNGENITVAAANAACEIVGPKKKEGCVVDWCASCGAPDVITQALDANSEENNTKFDPTNVFPEIPPEDMPPNVTMSTCGGWGGGPHYVTYTNTSYDYPDTGIFNLSGAGIDGFESQVCQCPYKNLNGSLHTKASYIAATAVKVRNHIIIIKGSTVKVNGTDYSAPGNYKFDGYVELEVQNGFVTVKGPPSLLGRAEFKSRSLLGPQNVTVHNTYTRVPMANTLWYDGLCTSADGATKKKKNTTLNISKSLPASEMLFDAETLAQLDEECFMPEFDGLPDLPWTDACDACGGSTYQSQALSSCAKLGSSEPFYTGCLEDFCSSCQYKCSENMAEDAKSMLAANGATQGTFPDGRDGCVKPHAVGDPHCQNARGESFDIHTWGALTMARIPRAETLESAGFSVIAHVEPSTAKRCGPTYVTSVDVQGKWLGVAPVTLHVGPQGVPQVDGLNNFITSVEGRRTFRKKGNTTIMETSGKVPQVMVKVDRYAVVVKQLAEGDFKYLNLEIRGIKDSMDEVGGLLGFDDHTAATQVPPECRRAQDGIATMVRDVGVFKPHLMSILTAN